MSCAFKYFVNNIQICSEYDMLKYYHIDLSRFVDKILSPYHFIIMFLYINLSCEKNIRGGGGGGGYKYASIRPF